MPQFAQVTGKVTFTPGDGAPIEIPRTRIEVTLSDDSATLSWEAAEGVASSAAIPRSQFDEYLEDGRIRWLAQDGRTG